MKEDTRRAFGEGKVIVRAATNERKIVKDVEAVEILSGTAAGSPGESNRK